MTTAVRTAPRAQHEVRALLMRLGDTLAPTELERLCQRIYIRAELWRPLLEVGEDRVCACLYLDSSVGVYLASWSPGDGTQMHDHEGTSGAVVVARGSICEARPGRDGQEEVLSLRAGSSVHFEASEAHRIENCSDLPAATIHCCSPPLEVTQVCPHAEDALKAAA